jgi:hypothetical protein
MASYCLACYVQITTTTIMYSGSARIVVEETSLDLVVWLLDLVGILCYDCLCNYPGRYQVSTVA